MMSSKMERFTQRARRVLSLAQEEAERMQQSSIGTGHLLLGLIREEGGVASQVLRDLGLRTNQVEQIVERLTSAEKREGVTRMDLSPEAKKVLEHAVDEARRMGHNYIGTEHLLLGLVRSTKGGAVDVFRELNISPDEIRRQTHRVLQENPPTVRRTPELPPQEPPPWPGVNEPSQPEASVESRLPERVLFLLILVGVLLLVILMIVTTAVQLFNLRDTNRSTRNVQWTITLQQGTPAPGEPTPGPVLGEDQRAQAAFQAASDTLAEAKATSGDAQNAVSSVETMLNFLQGAGFLVALALGAAAIYGFRNAQDTRRELKDEVKELGDTRSDLKDEMREFKDIRSEVDQHREALRNLPGVLDHLGSLERDVRESLEHIQPIFLDLLQANQELRLRNYEEAYTAVKRVLELDPDNPLGLYTAGWLELQYIPDQLEQGITHLERAVKLRPDWATAIAAYGVVLRRQALMTSGTARRDLFNRALGLLQQALGMNHNLIDLNLESLWGPVAGVWRDTGKYDEAIEAYERACNVTPGSSYPHGNLAALYLRKEKYEPGTGYQEKALDMFQKTQELARAELTLVPNDYFHVMDIAMSTMALGRRDPSNFDRAHDTLTEALNLTPTPEMLGVSRRGWANLLEYCPDDWTGLKENLQAALDRISRAADDARKASGSRQGS
jgi:tetratricopeptide (TPR) repeat protein